MVPDLRIIEQKLWKRVQARPRESARPECMPGQQAEQDHLWHHRRPGHLLTGKLFCGECGSSFGASGRDYLVCQAARRGGACQNRASVRRNRIEDQVLQALQHELMQPEMVATFVAEFTAEWSRLCAEATSGTAALRRELAGVERQLQGLIDMMIDGFRAPGLQGRLDGFEARKSELRASHPSWRP
jgi:site-specific DNA recombinase